MTLSTVAALLTFLLFREGTRTRISGGTNFFFFLILGADCWSSSKAPYTNEKRNKNKKQQNRI